MTLEVRKEVVEGNEIVERVKRYAPRVKDIIICSPFITKRGMGQLLGIFKKKDRVNLTVFSRFDELEWLTGVTDPEVFSELFELGRRKFWEVKIMLVDGLHAKAIVLGKRAAILGSANVTGGGFDGNFELGIVVRDSMVEAVRKRLSTLEEAGVELTSDALAAKLEYLKGPYCAHHRKLLAASRALHKERRPGLVSFTRDKGKPLDYTEHLVDFLSLIAGSSTPVQKSELIQWLHGKAHSEKPKLSDQRLSFVEDLGYIEEVPGGYRIHERGKRFLQASSPRHVLYSKLKSRWKEFKLLEEHLLKWGKKKALFNADTLCRIRAFQGREDIREESVVEYWNQRLRWLKSIGIIEEVKRRPMKYRVVPGALNP